MKIYTMKKEVRGCDDCPHARAKGNNSVLPVCRHPQITSDETLWPGKIPDWCPLPDAEEGAK
jgi:hypothetical protein